MSNFKFVLDYGGVRELLHSDGMVKVLEGYAGSVASKAGKGYKVKQMPTRAIVVETSTKEAEKDNLKNNTLLKAVHNDRKNSF